MTEPFLGPPLIVPTLDRIDFRHGYSPIFSSLPNELVHRIFQFAAAGDEKTCRVLCEVSLWARALALPHYIPTIILDEVEELDQFLTFPTTRPSPSWVHPLHFARHFWLSPYIVCVSERDPRSFMPQIMDMCPNLTSMALNGDSFLALVETRADAPWYHNHKDLEVKILFGGSYRDVENGEKLFTTGVATHNYSHPILHRVTRLTMHNLPEARTVPVDVVDLTAFPRLTHFAVEVYRCSSKHVRELFRRVLSVQSRQMTVILSCLSSAWDMIIEDAQQSPKIHTLDLPSDGTCTSAAWKEDLDEGTNIWERAVKFTQERHSTRLTDV